MEILTAIYKKHPKHYVAVDCSIFGYEDGELKLLLYPRGFEPARGKWSLMGGFVGEKESLEEAARRVLCRRQECMTFSLNKQQPFQNLIAIRVQGLSA